MSSLFILSGASLGVDKENSKLLGHEGDDEALRTPRIHVEYHAA